ncbi:MAG: hypothetical protein DMF38_13545 [Verrucomicrobia bacterium]|nr:MAG: hypothetical protein DME78_10300 [Verrucomicrobiota bacterium]PYL32867.1 MAG: hypothetical protein DMF38_13545 [Verrucomicrobiota bacterium]
MDYGVYPYDEPYARPRRRINYFAWTVAILLLIGFALAAWLGSFYIFNQPERPDSYRILQRLHKIEPPKRFELTAAPAGEFLNPKDLYERYSEMGNAELARTNAELARNYIRNYQMVRGLVPYVVGRYKIVAARELGPGDVFTSGMVALTNAVDNGELLMEHLYPANPEALPLMKQTLNVGLEIKLERSHDISSVIHAERLVDGRMMITAVPLLYGSYTVTRGLGTFRLEPPLSLNLAAGWPLFKAPERNSIEQRYAEYQKKAAVAQGRPISIPGISPSATPPPAANELVRVEQAIPLGTPPTGRVVAKNEKLANPTPPPKGRRWGKKQKLESPPPAVTPAPVIAQKPSAPKATPFTVASAATPPNIPAATPAPAANASNAQPAAVAQAPSVPTATPVPVLPAQPVPADASNVALASNAGGGSWKTFPPGRMPLGRLIGTGDLRDVAEHGLAGERVYLKGQFVVNFSDANKAVLRPRTKLTEKMLHFGGGSSTRIIVEFPAGYVPPRQGAEVSRDEQRPYEITEVRKQADGQLNVFVREIMQ